MYAGSLFVNQILGWNVYASTCLILAVTAVYTIGGKSLEVCTLYPWPCWSCCFWSPNASWRALIFWRLCTILSPSGGLAAVIYTDTLQAFILIIGAAVVSILGELTRVFLQTGKTSNCQSASFKRANDFFLKTKKNGGIWFVWNFLTTKKLQDWIFSVCSDRAHPYSTVIVLSLQVTLQYWSSFYFQLLTKLEATKLWWIDSYRLQRRTPTCSSLFTAICPVDFLPTIPFTSSGTLTPRTILGLDSPLDWRFLPHTFGVQTRYLYTRKKKTSNS